MRHDRVVDWRKRRDELARLRATSGPSVYEGRAREADPDDDAGWISLGEVDPASGRWLKPPRLWKPFGRTLPWET